MTTRPASAAAPLLAHRMAGRGEPLLLLNGGLMSLPAWDVVAPPLEAGFAVLRCDLRGQLLSPGPAPRDLAGHADDLVQLLDALGLSSVHVVGASFGAFVGMRLAAREPGRVRSLVAITAADRIPDDAWQATRPLLDAARAAVAGGDGGRVFDLMLPGTFSPGWLEVNARHVAERRARIAGLPPIWFEGLAGLLASLEGLDLRPELAQLRCPALVVAAENDQTFPVACSESLAASIPGAELAIIPGVGHALVVEAPQPLTSLILDFLARLGQKGAPS